MATTVDKNQNKEKATKIIPTTSTSTITHRISNEIIDELSYKINNMLFIMGSL
ncbi:hypothetical protein [Aquimarina addita]|uniref:hypothetical protein n=1 Tax=Aquimarina addita TaxID=870485 RepID=UPI0031EF087F